MPQLLLDCPEILFLGVQGHGVGMAKGMNALSWLVKVQLLQITLDNQLKGLGSHLLPLPDEEEVQICYPFALALLPVQE